MNNAVCAYEACVHPVRAKSLCSGHYTQQIKGKELSPLSRNGRKREPSSCTFDGCEGVVNAAGLCGGHYQQMRRGVELTTLTRRKKLGQCGATGCDRPSTTESSGTPLCPKHHQRWLHHGDVNWVSPRLRVRPIGLKVIEDAVASRDRSTCWTEWAELPCWDGLNGWGGKYIKDYPVLGNDYVMWLAMSADGRPRPKAPANHGLHACDNPRCWNPDHLRWGTRSDNARDMHRQRNYCQHCSHCNP